MWGLKTGEPSLFFYIIYSTSILHINQLLLKANRMFFLQNMVLLINKNFGLYACVIKQKFFNQTFRMRKAKKSYNTNKKNRSFVYLRCPIARSEEISDTQRWHLSRRDDAQKDSPNFCKIYFANFCVTKEQKKYHTCVWYLFGNLAMSYLSRPLPAKYFRRWEA